LSERNPPGATPSQNYYSFSGNLHCRTFLFWQNTCKVMQKPTKYTE